VPRTDDRRASGELVEMAPGKHIDVDLYWQSWRLSIGWLDDFGAVLRKRAAECLD
jgi:LysR family transcriptional regulator, chromosome initiation inhibitor